MGGTFSGGPYRVAQWATGNIGSRALRHIIEHPTMELVGVHVYGADKVGKDAGELAGVDPTGVQIALLDAQGKPAGGRPGIPADRRSTTRRLNA